MKLKVGILLLAAFPAGLFAQTSTIQMQCRDLASTGNYVSPDETVINGQACRPVQAPAQIAQSTSKPAPAAMLPASATPTEQPAVRAAHCVVLKRMGPADEITSRMYSFGVRGKQFQYVEGELPDGVKFHGRLTDNDVRKIQSKGGHVVVMEPKYTESDLREAKQGCKEQ